MTQAGYGWDEFALLLIDVQRDFRTDEIAAAFPQFDANVRYLLETCRDEGIDVIHLRARFRPDKSDWMVRYTLGDRIPCIDGTPGAEILECADAAPGEAVLYKQTFDGFLNPALDAKLSTDGKRFLLVAGLVTSVCVLTTAASAAQRGYLVAVVEDCCADQPAAHEHTLERYPFIFSRTTSRDFVAMRDDWLAELSAIASR